MIDDLRHFKADDDGFQLVSPDLAIFLLILGVVIGYVLGAWK